MNLCLYPEEFTLWSTLGNPAVTPNTNLAPDGQMTADRLEDTVINDYPRILQDIVIPNVVQSWTFSIHIKKDNDENRFPEIHFRTPGVPGGGAQINTKTGATIVRFGSLTASSDDAGDYWRFIMTLLNQPPLTSVKIQIFPALAKVFGGADVSALGSIIAWGAKLEVGTIATPYVSPPLTWYEHTVTVTATCKVWNEAADMASSVSAVQNFTGEDIKRNSVQREMFKTVSSVVVDSTAEQTNI